MKKYVLMAGLLLGVFSIFIYPQKQQKIAIHFSNSTEVNESKKLLEKITFWELLFLTEKIKYDVIYDSDLESGISIKKYHTIIFPYSKALSDKAYKSILNYLDKGGSIIVFGQFAFFDNKLNLRGFDRFESLFGVIHVDSISREKMSGYLNLLDFYPLTGSVVKKTDIQITSINTPLLVEAIAQNTNSLGNIKSDSEKKELEKSLIVLQSNLKSKLLWFSFDPIEVIGGKDDYNSVLQIIKNAITWFGGGTIN